MMLRLCGLRTPVKRLAGILVVGVVLVALVGGLVFGCAGPAAAPAGEMPKFPAGSMMDTIQKRGYLIAGVRHDVPDMGYLDPITEKLDGIDIRIVQEFARALFNDPTKVTYKQTTGKTRVPMVRAHDVDTAIANMTITPTRAEQVDFSKPYISMRYKLALLKTSPINTWEDLMKKPDRHVCGIKGAEFVAMAYEAAGFKMTQLELFPEVLAGLRAGHWDAMQGDEWMIDRYVADSTDLKSLLEKPGFLQPNDLGAAFHKDNPELTEFFNEVLTDLTRSGRLIEIVHTFVPTADPGCIPK